MAQHTPTWVKPLHSLHSSPCDSALGCLVIHEQGDAVVDVEQRSGQQGFGRGTKTSMTFREFVKRAAAGDASVYLSTQEVSTEHACQVCVVSIVTLKQDEWF